MLIDNIIKYLAPFDCVRCGAEGEIACRDCLPRIPKIKRSSCFLCNKLTDGFKACQTCRRKTKLRGVIVASHYDGQVKVLIKKLKYERAVAAAKPLAKILASHILAVDFDLVTWVPASTKRRRQRGYNQAQLIARHLAYELELPYGPLLGKIGQSRQVGTSRRERITQMDGKIYVTAAKRAENRRVLVVDDVVTTGATMSECGRALREAGAKYIWGAAVAKH